MQAATWQDQMPDACAEESRITRTKSQHTKAGSYVPVINLSNNIVRSRSILVTISPNKTKN